MAKIIFTIEELVADGWTLDDVDGAIAASKLLRSLNGFTNEAKRNFVEWNDYSDTMQLSKAAWDAFLATDRTGRDAMDFYISDFSDDEKVLFGINLGSSGSTMTIADGRFRAGDRIIIRTIDTYIGRKGNPVNFKAAKTIRFVEVYPANGFGEIKARFIIEEVIGEMSDRDRAFEEASSDERRKISQRSAAAEIRKAAKALGGKALAGTPAQQKWAETIRKDALATVSNEVAGKLLVGKKFQAAKWWIENRFDANKPHWLAQQAA